MTKKMQSMDGNTAATHVAYAFSDVAAIYPITPSSNMGELADAWAAAGRKNIFDQVVDVVEMQSEAGAAGAVHGSLSGGALTTTFTASQGLMLMLPNMHKIAGEMQPTVFHVSARSLAAQSLSIFGDHSDVMSARNTGFAMIASSSIQEIMDLAAVAHMATLTGSIPFLHFFDGFRNSHEIQKIEVVDYEQYKELCDCEAIETFRNRSLNPERPVIKVGAQNPDVYFQGRETVNKYYDELPQIVQDAMDKYAAKIGRQYHLFDYVGAADAEKVIIAMGSGCETIEETINYLNEKGEKLGLVKIRLYRPFAIDKFVEVLPATVKKIAVLDRTKEPGSIGEPLYLDVVSALKGKDIKIIGGRYGLSSKEFTPTMVKAVYDHLDGSAFHGFTVGINDDVTGTSLEIKEKINTIPAGTISCKFWGLGSDGTVGANKNSIKIIGDNTDKYAQGYFEYDSKKSGGITRSHLRFGDEKIQSEYLVTEPDFIAVSQQSFIERYDVLKGIKKNGIFLLNSNWSREDVFSHFTESQQSEIIEKQIEVYNIDALKIAEEVGLGHRVNTVMQAAFFIISKVLPKDQAISLIKKAIEKTYMKKGKEVVEMNHAAVDMANANIEKIEIPASLPGKAHPRKNFVPDDATGFTKDVIEKVMLLEGDDIPVSKMPLDGTVPPGTTKLEKRGVAPMVPHWIAEKCIQCNQCSLVCPHAAIRTKLIDRTVLTNAPASFNTLKAMSTDGEKYDYKVQVYIDDCQSCKVCVNTCPKGALDWAPIEDERVAGQSENEKFFDALPEILSEKFTVDTIKGSQFKKPLLEFSGACAGCGETAYVKLLTQLFGDRMVIANATGCSSIWGGTFPTIPYTTNDHGEGPSWANSLFEDNAEYGFGMRLAINANRKMLKSTVEKLLTVVNGELKEALTYALENWKAVDEAAKNNSRKLKGLLKTTLESTKDDDVRKLLKKAVELKDYFIEKSIWAIGGDGWAYDIGYGGLDHVMASGRNINILVLDTEVYSNTGGQASKSTPLGSIARFAESGKATTKKDLGKMMMTYGYVYVASVSLGANMNQVMKAFIEAESYDGPSIIIAYAPCINHGINMANAVNEEKLAVETGYWITYRYNPDLEKEGKNPFILDSREPKKSVEEILDGENRYSALKTSFPEKEKAYREQTIKWVAKRFEDYKKMAE
ncbi:MAG: pyruvate:ferredoxin (flavodoxin) oxidoreductase [Candidatus Marinimicrobia bacterium]|nr:pyruvate:ferredoxin (flavodoxin) oxidoreductase [Candidatus Neomarinimicrobiota bacterium]